MALRSLAAPHPRFAALRALHRLLAPRHPPNALLRLALHLFQFPFRVSVSDSRAIRSRSDQAAPYMRTQFSSANKLARFGKIEAVINARDARQSRIALSSHYVVVQEHLARLPERAGKLCSPRERGFFERCVLSEIVPFFEALTYIAIGPHMVSRGLGPTLPKLVHIPQKACWR